MELEKTNEASDCLPSDPKKSSAKAERLLIDGDTMWYAGNGRGIGVYVSQDSLTSQNYFELDIVNTDFFGAVSVGVCHSSYPLTKMPGWGKDSLGYHGDDGMLYRGNAIGYRFGPRCGKGDRMGCGIRKINPQKTESGTVQPQGHYVYFTKNGKEIGSVSVEIPADGLYPCIGLAGPQDAIRLGGSFPATSPGPLILSPHSPPPRTFGEDHFMAVDYNQDDWRRMVDVKLSGQYLSYCGRGEQIEDVGLAVGRLPLSPASHYFQIQVIDPGRHAYITIGITKKNYPKRCHPGWRKGSVAYHADDGRVFTGATSGWGMKIGPACGRGDIMGCGILFPRNYCHNYVSVDSSGEESEGESSDDSRYSHNSSFEEEVPGHNIVNSDAVLESPEDFPPLNSANNLIDNETEEGYEAYDEEVEEEEEEDLYTHMKNKRRQFISPKVDHHNNGFINRNSVLFKQLSNKDKADEGKGVVQVFFTRNGALLGRVEAVVPKGGFYPSISLGAKKEMVKVDLRPLSG